MCVKPAPGMCGPCRLSHINCVIIIHMHILFCATVMHRFFTSPVSLISSPVYPEKYGGESLSLRKCILSQVDVCIIFECVFSIRTPRGFLHAEIGHKILFQQFHRLRHTCKNQTLWGSIYVFFCK